MITTEFAKMNVMHGVRLKKFNDIENMKKLWLLFEKILVEPTMKALYLIWVAFIYIVKIIPQCRRKQLKPCIFEISFMMMTIGCLKPKCWTLLIWNRNWRRKWMNWHWSWIVSFSRKITKEQSGPSVTQSLWLLCDWSLYQRFNSEQKNADLHWKERPQSNHVVICHDTNQLEKNQRNAKMR